MRTLPARQRAAVVLRHYEDLSEAQTAEILGCSVGTVKSLTARGLGQLRAALPPDQSVTPPPRKGK
ncbi:sigma factor-like helix-turn-helix DNA-binding protein [Dactylosporangium sp. CA-139066]|uniref:sigma factor-like helix-turn-helix DNA-binding protein n=1 Tax=Dactylosporangium sp. CA-139066 TaxID=3239930 RepID=UPI003D8B5DEF